VFELCRAGETTNENEPFNVTLFDYLTVTIVFAKNNKQVRDLKRDYFPRTEIPFGLIPKIAKKIKADESFFKTTALKSRLLRL